MRSVIIRFVIKHLNMTDKKVLEMMPRRRCCKKITLIVIPLVLSIYIMNVLFGDWNTPKLLSLTDLHRCPACYGISVCPELYSNQIWLDMSDRWTGWFNAKNIYHGVTKFNRRVVIKKLAHDSELREFDLKMCDTFNLPEKCKPIRLLNVSNLDREVINTVQYNFTFPDMKPRKGLVMCPYADSVFDLAVPILGKTKHQIDMLYVWTMLNVNPEPIILQLLKKSAGWPVPSYGGVCGRLEVVADEGDSLSTLMHVPYRKKLIYAQKIVEAAMDFTYKHDRFRFYLMDWSLDNIVANEADDISFIDLEDIVVLDKHISPGTDLPDWYQRYKREPLGSGFTFSIDNMCTHHLSDHNLWAACYILAGDEDPYLYPIPKTVNTLRPNFHKLLMECLNGEDRFKSITNLHQFIKDMLVDDKLEGLDAVS